MSKRSTNKDASLAHLVHRFHKEALEFVKTWEGVRLSEDPSQFVVPERDISAAKRLADKLAQYTRHQNNRHLWCRRLRCDEALIWLVAAIAVGAGVCVALLIALVVKVF